MVFEGTRGVHGQHLSFQFQMNAKEKESRAHSNSKGILRNRFVGILK